jgi:hypothetical protein
MSSSGMLRSVTLVIAEVSEEHSTSIIGVTRIGELGTTLAVTNNRRTRLTLFLVHRFFVTLMMKALRSSETSVLTRPSWPIFPEDGILHSHRREYLKSYIALNGWAL